MNSGLFSIEDSPFFYRISFILFNDGTIFQQSFSISLVGFILSGTIMVFNPALNALFIPLGLSSIAMQFSGFSLIDLQAIV